MQEMESSKSKCKLSCKIDNHEVCFIARNLSTLVKKYVKNIFKEGKLNYLTDRYVMTYTGFNQINSMKSWRNMKSSTKTILRDFMRRYGNVDMINKIQNLFLVTFTKSNMKKNVLSIYQNKIKRTERVSKWYYFKTPSFWLNLPANKRFHCQTTS